MKQETNQMESIKHMELLTAKEVSFLLKIKINTLYNWVYLGKIDAIKISRRLLRFRQKDIIKLHNGQNC